MAKKISRSVTRTFADHEVIIPRDTLRKAIGRSQDAGDDPVARADAALAKLSGEFSGWMHADCERLAATWQKTRKSSDRTNWRELFRVAHDIKGQAETFGFTAAGDVAESLCMLIEGAQPTSEIPQLLVDQHVEAVAAIVRESKLKDAEETAARLALRLRQVTDDFLATRAQRQQGLGDHSSPDLAPE